MTYDVACPICGRVNRRLYLEETEGWMECESCGSSSQHFPFAKKLANQKIEMTKCISRFDHQKSRKSAIFRGYHEKVAHAAPTTSEVLM